MPPFGLQAALVWPHLQTVHFFFMSAGLTDILRPQWMQLYFTGAGACGLVWGMGPDWPRTRNAMVVRNTEIS